MMRKKVVCDHCAFLVVVEGVPPLCIATASLVDSPLRKAVDLRGMVQARQRNANKNCKKRRRFSLRALKIRMWIREDCERRGLEYKGKDLTEYRYEKDERPKSRRGTGEPGGLRAGGGGLPEEVDGGVEVPVSADLESSPVPEGDRGEGGDRDHRQQDPDQGGEG